MAQIGLGILGATVVPHALLLGSSLAKQDRLRLDNNKKFSPPPNGGIITHKLNVYHYLSQKFKIRNVKEVAIRRRSEAFIRATWKHACIDTGTLRY